MTTSEPTPSSLPTGGVRPNLYALVVGVGAYQRVRPLRGPARDAQAMASYIQRLPNFDPHLLLLTDSQAGKQAIIAGFQSHLTQAGPADTVLFYFAGHGAQEEADTTIWTSETDGQLETIVCFDGGTTNTWEFLLADKELRYLIEQVSKTGAHVAAIFDCCHSGDNTRNVDLLAETLDGQDVLERRLAQSAPRRPYEGFFFHDVLPLDQLQKLGPEMALPQGAHIQMAACESDELAVEVNAQGVFTKNLLTVLEAAHGQLSYRDLHNRVRQYMRFAYEQQPRVYVPGLPESQTAEPGEQTTLLLSRGFLNQPIDENALSASALYNSQQQAWLLDVGAIHGLGRPKQTIQLHDEVTKTAYPVSLSRVGADYAVLTITDEVRGSLDPVKVYRATVTGLLTQPIRVHFTNHGGPSGDLLNLLGKLNTRSAADGTSANQSQTFFISEEDETKADYTLHVRNGLYYITRPADENRPLIRPIPASDPSASDPSASEASAKFALDSLYQQLHHLSQWQYLKELRNPDATGPVLSVVVTPGNGTPIPLTEAHPAPLPISFTQTKVQSTTGTKVQWTTSLTIELTNPTDKPLYCTVLYLSRQFRSFQGFLPTNSPLEPNSKQTIALGLEKPPAPRQTALRLSLEEVLWQYNWPSATEHFKLLVTTNPLSETTLAFLTLDKLPSPPVLSDRLKPVSSRDAFDTEDVSETEPLPDWSTQTITLQLVNPLYNTVRADELAQMLEAPADARQEDTMADFALGLYYEPDLTNPLQPGLKLRSDIRVLEDEGQRGLLTDITTAVINAAAHRVQNRRYVQNLIRYPDRTRIVAEGDSWFQYPFLLRDVVDYLSGVYSVFSLASSGATLDDYLKDTASLEAIAQVKPSFFLLSGGSNDLLGESFADYIRDTPDATKTGPERYLSDTFQAKLTHIGNQYGRIFRLVQQGYPQVRVVVHGYDYVIPTDEATQPNRPNRLGKILLQKGIDNQAGREGITNFIIDAFNEKLRQAASPYPQVTYLDLRDTIRRNDPQTNYWYDEVNPNDKGFLSLSSKFIQVISGKKPDEQPPPDTSTTPASSVDSLPTPSPVSSSSSPAPRWSDAFLWSKRKLGDPIADQVITTLLAENQKGEVDQIFQMLVRNRQFPNPAFDVLPEPVKKVVEDYFIHTRQLPAYAEPFRLMIAADVFKNHGPKMLMILLCRSLPLCYTCWRGAKVLYRTGRLRVHDGSLDAFSRRLMETAQFVVDMLTVNNFEQDGNAIVATQKVRLMHAVIRHFAQERNWDADTYGVPINQEDLAGTLMSFGVVIIDGLEKLGITLTPEQREAYLHLWRVVGSMMGIDDDLLSEDETECRALMQAILDQQSGPSTEGAELTEACIDLMNAHLIVGPLKRLTPYFVRFFIGDHYADMLSVPAVEVDNSFIMNTVQWFDQSVRGLDDRNLLMAAMGRAFSHGMIERIMAYTNAAKSEQFYLPSALSDSWEATQPDFRIPPLEHIEDVIFYLDKVARHFRAQNNPMGLFTAVYRVVTQRVADGLKEGIFSNPAEMERLDVGFGNRYFEAINCYFDGKPATGPWQVSFDAAQLPVVTNQHIFSAANAHITFDLPIVLAEVFRGQDLNGITADFALMNQLFDDMFDQMNNNVGRIYRPFGRILRFIDTRFKNMERSMMTQNRDMAWKASTELHGTVDEAEQQRIIARLEAQSAALGLKVVRPFVLLRFLLQRIARNEFGTPAQKVDVMLRTALLPSALVKTG